MQKQIQPHMHGNAKVSVPQVAKYQKSDPTLYTPLLLKHITTLHHLLGKKRKKNFFEKGE